MLHRTLGDKAPIRRGDRRITCNGDRRCHCCKQMTGSIDRLKDFWCTSTDPIRDIRGAARQGRLRQCLTGVQ